MLNPLDAWRRLLEHLDPLPAETLPRRRGVSRVLARPLAATVDVPAADVSAMDGFALPAAPDARPDWPVAGRIVAGDAPGFALPPGRAVRIMTGAPVPAGADRVIPVELTEAHSLRSAGGAETETMRVLEAGRTPEAVPAGAHIRRRGEVLRTGDPLLPAGAPLTPGALSLLATHGIAEVAVHGAPRVSLLVTGDEVVPPEETPAPGHLRDSHSDFLLAALAGLRIAPRHLGIAPDDPAGLREKVEAGVTGSDVLLLTGGVSMGEMDFVEGVLGELGYRPLFTSVAIQPGKPLTVAVRDEAASGADSHGDRARLVFGLPGNPGSVMVSFWLFVVPALRRLMGHEVAFLEGLTTGILDAPLPGAKARDRFIPATLRWSGDGWRVTPHPTRGSHDVAAYAHGRALVRVPAGDPARSRGERCTVLPLAC
jgi:molybdopterin molybdotransferase